MTPLIHANTADRQGPKAEDLARLYRELHQHNAAVSLPDFVRLAALSIDAAAPPPEEDAR